MNCKFVGVNRNGQVVNTYRSMNEAAKETGYNVTTLYYRSYDYRPSPNGILYIREEKFRDLQKTQSIEACWKGKVNLHEGYVPKKKKSDNQVNHIVPYEVQAKVICITPCPFLSIDEHPVRPKVGSAKCCNCYYFVEKDMENHTVKCSYNKSGFKHTKKKPESN